MAELLAPAGTMECLETALYFGADAVYIAGKRFGLRAFAANFDDDEIIAAAKKVHAAGKRLYITVNSVISNEQLPELTEYLRFLKQAEADAVILSDPSIIKIIKDNAIDLEMHLSTQLNTFNYMSCAFWHEAGVKRIVLSRELSLEDIKAIIEEKPASLEIETFIHGAMCAAHSGRCLLSSFFTGRSGNKGECAQPCRWRYHISEEGYAGQFFPIAEDENGTYILNSKDLMMIGHIDELISAGITSLKIEGRMKSPYYVASVVGAYRRAIDAYYADPNKYSYDERLGEELTKSATRKFCTGFYFGEAQQDTERTESARRYSFVGIVLDDAKGGGVLVEQRNKFLLGDTLEVLSPTLRESAFEVTSIINEDGEFQESAPHPQQHITLACPLPLKKGDILRKLI